MPGRRRDILERFPRERTWLLPALQALQHDERWLSTEALAEAADHLRVPRSEVWGVATHYPEFRLAPPGRSIVRVCTGVSCRIQGSVALLDRLADRLGLAPLPAQGGTTADGQVTLEPLECAFNCSMAPVVEVEGRHLGRVGPGEVERVLGALSAPAPEAGGEAPPAALPHAGGKAPLPDLAFPSPPPSPIPRGQRWTAQGRDAARWLAAIERAARALTPAPGTRLAVEAGSCSLAAGAAATLGALAEEVGRRGVRAHVVASGCSGLCWAAPVVQVLPPEGESLIAIRVGAGDVGALLDAVRSGTLASDREALEVLGSQRRLLTERMGLTDPRDMADAIRRGAYTQLARVLAEGRPEAVIDAVKAAGLAGRGGAYFPAAVKWEAARRVPAPVRYLVVNAEEGEPGIFKDRHLVEGDPHRLLEGALLAAYAAGAGMIYLYVHGEAHLAARRLARAVEDARHWGLVSRHVLGSDWSVDIEIRRGAGGFVLGEETALLESLEGRRAMPRARPPFPVEAGLWGRPTVINNVETLSAVPPILAWGAEAWRALGGGHGTKCFGLSGHLRRPGLVEVPLGTTLRHLIETLGGGTPGGRPVQAVLVGGPSGSLVPPTMLDEPMGPGGPVNPGTGGVAVLDDSVSLRDVVRTLLDFNTRESCGKCTPCREGTARLRDLLDGAVPGGPGEVADLSEVVRLASLCGLGQAAPLSLLSALRHFPGVLAG
jgi:NADH-quinone oxidoreductase subunit F